MKCPGTHPRWSRSCLCQTIPFATAQVHAKSPDSSLLPWATQWRVLYHCSPLPPKKRRAKRRAPPCATHRELPGRNKGAFLRPWAAPAKLLHILGSKETEGKSQSPNLRIPPRTPGRNKGAFLRPWALHWGRLPTRHTLASRETGAIRRAPPCATHREFPGGNKGAFLRAWATHRKPLPHDCIPWPPKKRRANPRAPTCASHRELPEETRGHFSVRGLCTGGACPQGIPWPPEKRGQYAEPHPAQPTESSREGTRVQSVLP